MTKLTSAFRHYENAPVYRKQREGEMMDYRFFFSVCIQIITKFLDVPVPCGAIVSLDASTLIHQHVGQVHVGNFVCSASVIINRMALCQGILLIRL